MPSTRRGASSDAAELIWSRWTLANAATCGSRRRLDAMSLLAEARYRIFPGVHIAGRAERLGLQPTSDDRWPDGLGCCGATVRSRRELRHHPQRDRQGVVAAQPARRRPCAARQPWRAAGRVLVLSACGRSCSSLPGCFGGAVLGPAPAAERRRARRSGCAATTDTGAIRGRLDIRRIARPTERRPEVAESGSAARSRITGSAPRGHLPRDGAARRVRRTRAGPRHPRPAKRNVRPARAGGHGRNRRGLPQQRPARTTTCFRCRKPKRFDLGRYAAGRSKSVRFDTRLVSFGCFATSTRT